MEAIHNNATSPELIEELAIEFLECLPPKLKQYMLTDKDIAFAEKLQRDRDSRS